jgi:hypothetical protein
MASREILLKQLDDTVSRLLHIYANLVDSEIMVYEVWTAKDILGHVTFWHASFARNVSDLVHGVKPTPLKGRFIDLNQGGVDEMRKHSLDVVIARFEAAHKVIRENIRDPRLVLIPYKKGSRDYTPEEHLDIVNEHIQSHLKDMLGAIEANPCWQRKHQS